MAGSITLLPASPIPPGSFPPAGCPEGNDHASPEANRYRLSSAVIRQIVSRHQHCTYPGCPQPSSRCDLDHVRPFDQGGYSCTCNMRPACRRHHRLKTFGGWQARLTRPDEPYPYGTIIWTTPDGTSHNSAPPCLPGMKAGLCHLSPRRNPVKEAELPAPLRDRRPTHPTRPAPIPTRRGQRRPPQECPGLPRPDPPHVGQLRRPRPVQAPQHRRQLTPAPTPPATKTPTETPTKTPCPPTPARPAEPAAGSRGSTAKPSMTYAAC